MSLVRILRNRSVARVGRALLLLAMGFSVATGREAEQPAKNTLGLGLYCAPFATAEETSEFIAKCQHHGVKTLYPSLSGGGTVIWRTDKELYYTALKDALDQGYDSLADLISQAHAAGMKVYPSVAICPACKFLDEHPEWETHDRTGKLSSATTTRAFSPAFPAARAAKIAVLMDLVNGYEVDGVMLDYCRYPENSKSAETKYGYYGYDEPHLTACQTKHNFDPRTEPIDSRQWNVFNKLREDSVTAFVREFRTAVDRSGKKIRIGGFGDTDPAYEARMCGRNCVAWARQGLIDDYFLATYAEGIDEMPKVVKRARRMAGPQVVLLSALSPFNRFLTTNDQMVAATKAQLAAGADGVWIYRSDFLDELKLWDGASAAAKLVAR